MLLLEHVPNLRNITEFTPTQIINYVEKKLLEQGHKAQASIGTGDRAYLRCVFRAPDGAKCAVGHLIPDEEYRKEWDRPGVSLAPISRAFGFTPTNNAADMIRFLSSLQTSLHDSIEGDFCEGVKEGAEFLLERYKTITRLTK